MVQRQLYVLVEAALHVAHPACANGTHTAHGTQQLDSGLGLSCVAGDGRGVAIGRASICVWDGEASAHQLLCM